MPNGLVYLSGGFYHSLENLSHLSRFLRKFEDRLKPLPFDKDSVLKAINQIILEYKQVDGKIDNEVALRLLMADDLQKVAQILTSTELPKKIESEVPFEENLTIYRDKGVSILRDLGLTIDPPDIFILDKLPAPYDKASYSVIATDEDDYKQHGIAPGLHFLKEKLRPFLSPFLLLHELIHTVLGLKSPLLFGRGLEEGLAEIIGSMYLSSKILGKELTTNLFIYNRLSYPPNQFWEIYLDYTRQAAYLYREFGLNGLVAIIEKGREDIKSIENNCLRNNLSKINLPKGQWDNDLTDMVNFLLFTFPRNLVVSPLAKYLAPFVLPYKTTIEVLTEANVELESGRQALQELQTRIVMAVFREDLAVVSLSDSELLAPGSVIRYEIPEK